MQTLTSLCTYKFVYVREADKKMIKDHKGTVSFLRDYTYRHADLQHVSNFVIDNVN